MPSGWWLPDGGKRTGPPSMHHSIYATISPAPPSHLCHHLTCVTVSPASLSHLTCVTVSPASLSHLTCATVSPASLSHLTCVTTSTCPFSSRVLFCSSVTLPCRRDMVRALRSSREHQDARQRTGRRTRAGRGEKTCCDS